MTGKTNITVTLKDTGSISLKPKAMQGVVPSGTSLVPSTWLARFYYANGTFICQASSFPPGCGFPPDTSNGGTIRVTFLVTMATMGENLTLTYTFNQNGLIATDTIPFTVT